MSSAGLLSTARNASAERPAQPCVAPAERARPKCARSLVFCATALRGAAICCQAIGDR